MLSTQWKSWGFVAGLFAALMLVGCGQDDSPTEELEPSPPGVPSTDAGDPIHDEFDDAPPVEPETTGESDEMPEEEPEDEPEEESEDEEPAEDEDA